MTDKERIQRLEFLIRLMVVHYNAKDQHTCDVVDDIIDEYCGLHNIPNPYNI